jgi:hypothetical protein
MICVSAAVVANTSDDAGCYFFMAYFEKFATDLPPFATIHSTLQNERPQHTGQDAVL